MCMQACNVSTHRPTNEFRIQEHTNYSHIERADLKEKVFAFHLMHSGLDCRPVRSTHECRIQRYRDSTIPTTTTASHYFQETFQTSSEWHSQPPPWMWADVFVCVCPYARASVCARVNSSVKRSATNRDRALQMTEKDNRGKKYCTMHTHTSMRNGKTCRHTVRWRMALAVRARECNRCAVERARQLVSLVG